MLRDINPLLRVIKAAVAKYPEPMWAESEFPRLDGFQMLKSLMSEPPKVPGAKRTDGPQDETRKTPSFSLPTQEIVVLFP